MNMPAKIVITLICLNAFGCATAPGRIFEPPSVKLVWPAPPEQSRIAYVGQLSSSEDLKPGRKLMQGVVEFMVGKEASLPLYGPRSVYVSPDGTKVWVADPGGRCLHLFDMKSRGYKKIVQLNNTALLSPVGLAAGPGDTMYVCDSEAITIHQISTIDGKLIATVRLPEELRRPSALIYRAAAQELYVVDTVAHDVKVLDHAGRLKRILGERGAGPGQFNFPCAIADDGETLWIADAGNQRVQGMTGEGEPVVSFGQAGDAPGDLALPKAVAVDRDGLVYVVDARFENIQLFDRSGRLLLFLGAEGRDAGAFWLPSGIFIDRNDRMWVCDSYNQRIQVFDILHDENDVRNLSK